MPCRPRTSWANLWFLSALRPLQVNHCPTLTYHHTSNQPRSQHCKVIHCRFCSGRLWHHYTLFPPFVPGKASDDDDNTKTEAAKMQKEYELLKDSTKDIQTAAEISEYMQGSYIIFTSMFMVSDHIKSLSGSAGVIELFNWALCRLADILISLY